MRLTVKRIFVYFLLTLLANVAKQIRVSDYYIPDIILDEELEQDVFYGKYRSSRLDTRRNPGTKDTRIIENNTLITNYYAMLLLEVVLCKKF